MARLRTFVLVLLPSLTFLAGIGQALVQPDMAFPDDFLVTAGLGLAVIAPLVAALLLTQVSPGFDEVLFASAAMLAAIGAATLFLLAIETSIDRDFYEEVAVRHGLFVSGGFLALVTGAWLARHVDRLRRYPYTLALVALALTATTVVLGQSVNGARLWLQLGPLRFQPSEVARLFLAAFVSMYLFDRRHLVSDAWRVGRIELPPAPHLIPIVGGVLAAVAVLVAQNDLGMAALIALSVFVIVSGVMQSRPGTIGVVGLLLLSATGAYLVVPRVQDRVAGWLDPWRAPMGTGFQFVQADYALAAGGATGRASAGAATRVPEIHTDFILVAIGSRFGALAAAAILALCAILVLRCVINALRAREGAGAYFALSLAVLFGVQIVLIVGGVLRVLPLTGLTLPLVSYGGTSMLVTLFAVGLILGIGSPRLERRSPGATWPRTE